MEEVQGSTKQKLVCHLEHHKPALTGVRFLLFFISLCFIFGLPITAKVNMATRTCSWDLLIFPPS
jgi:hypothetical protein